MAKKKLGLMFLGLVMLAGSLVISKPVSSDIPPICKPPDAPWCQGFSK